MLSDDPLRGQPAPAAPPVAARRLGPQNEIVHLTADLGRWARPLADALELELNPDETRTVRDTAARASAYLDQRGILVDY